MILLGNTSFNLLLNPDVGPCGMMVHTFLICTSQSQLRGLLILLYSASHMINKGNAYGFFGEELWAFWFHDKETKMGVARRREVEWKEREQSKISP